MRDLIGRLIQDERGIQHAEEALLMALIAVAAIVAVTSFSDDIQDVFAHAGTELCAAPVVCDPE